MKILIIAFSDLDKDARISRQINWLKAQHELSVIAFNSSKIEGINLYQVSNSFPLVKKIIGAFLLKMGLFMQYYFNLKEIKQSSNYLKHKDFEIIIANDIQSLPLALKYKKKAKVYFDAHEYSPKEHDSDWFWCFFFEKYNSYLCRKFIPFADAMTTVSYHIAEEYEKVYKKKVDLLLNFPNKYELEKPILNNTKLFRFVHHGVALPQRNMELMISVFEQLGKDYILDLYLVPTNYAYYLNLQKLCANHQNIKIYPALEINKILDTISQYDAGVFLLPSNSFNYIYTLPNKLFDFIQARLAVIIGPSPEMKRIVEHYNCGYVTRDFELEHIVTEIKKISKEDIRLYKENAHQAAQELNAEKSKEIFLNIIKQLTTEKNNSQE